MCVIVCCLPRVDNGAIDEVEADAVEFESEPEVPNDDLACTEDIDDGKSTRSL